MAMKYEKVLTNLEKWNFVKELLIQDNSFREIQRIVHISPNFITKVKRAEFGENTVDSDNENLKKNKKLSKTTQAIDLFYKGKTSREVLLELDISIDEVKKVQADYFQLLNLDDISKMVQNNKNSNFIKEFCDLFMVFKELGIDTIEKVKEIKDLVEDYPNLNYEISNLTKEIYNLKMQKKEQEQVLSDIKSQVSLANASYNEIENQIKNKKLIIQNLECLIDRMKSPEANNNFKKLIDPIIKDEFWYKTTILPVMIISVFEVIRNDPIGKNMVLEYYNNNPESLYNNKNKNSKETDIEYTINYIYNNYLPIIMDINEYSQRFHDNLHRIYPSYLFSLILKMSHFDNLYDAQKSQKKYENNNTQFSFNFNKELNNNNSYIE